MLKVELLKAELLKASRPVALVIYQSVVVVDYYYYYMARDVTEIQSGSGSNSS